MAFKTIPPLLRVGLYDDWLGEVTQYLAAETPGLQHYLTEASREIWLDFETRSAEAARAILMFVPFHLRARIDPADILDPPRMLATLKKETRPFDLFGLPRELRDNVYECIEEFQDDRTVVFNAYFGGRQNALPAITQASRQLRNEARAMFIKHAKFDFVFASEDDPHGDGLGTAGPHKIMASWFFDVINDAMEHLRYVQMQFEARDWEGSMLLDSCCVEYDNTAGLSCSSPLPDSALEQLFAKAIKCSKKAGLEDKKGEDIAGLLFCATKAMLE